MNVPSHIRRFQLHRVEDESGISGTGLVAEGVLLTGGRVVLHWLTVYGSVNIYDNMEVLMALHGHHGKTKVVYQDPEAA